MKRFDFDPLIGNEEFKRRAESLLEGGGSVPALLISGEDGCGRNFAARLVAAAYLSDGRGLVERGVHPDCVVVSGGGASGAISVESVRSAVYELGKSAVTSDGRRVCLVCDAHNLNMYSANALLKTLEQPPAGVLFVLTARRESDLLPTVLSRCVRLRVGAVPPETASGAVAARFPAEDRERASRLCGLFGGRVGLVIDTLGDRNRLALAQCAERAYSAALEGDKLGFLAALEGGCADRASLKWALFCLSLCVERSLSLGETVDEGFAKGVGDGYRDVSKNINLKLLCARIASRL